MSWTIYYERNKDVILNGAKYCYKNNNERIRDNARDKYKSLSGEERNKKRKNGKNRYQNMSKEKKQKLKEYQKIIGKLKYLTLVINIFCGFSSVCYSLVMHC